MTSPATTDATMRLHHIGLAVRSIDEAAGLYAGLFGLRHLSPTIEDPIQQVRVAFGELAPDVHVEFIEPTSPTSPVAAVVARGGGFYHLCFTVTSLNDALDRARSAGALEIVAPVPAAAFGGRRIAFVMMPSRDIIEFLEEGQPATGP